MKLRDYKIYIVNGTVEERDHLENEMGELVGYSEPYRVVLQNTVIARSADMALTWFKQFYAHRHPDRVHVASESAVNAFVMEIEQ